MWHSARVILNLFHFFISSKELFLSMFQCSVLSYSKKCPLPIQNHELQLQLQLQLQLVDEWWNRSGKVESSKQPAVTHRLTEWIGSGGHPITLNPSSVTHHVMSRQQSRLIFSGPARTISGVNKSEEFFVCCLFCFLFFYFFCWRRYSYWWWEQSQSAEKNDGFFTSKVHSTGQLQYY